MPAKMWLIAALLCVGVVFQVDLTAAVATADSSPVCGDWRLNCSAGPPGSNVFVETQLYFRPIFWTQPTNATGTFYHKGMVYAHSSCASETFLAKILGYGEWVDRGPGGSLSERQIEVFGSVFEVTPQSAAAVSTLQTTCPCGSSSLWQTGATRTLLKCPDTCRIPWVNFSLPGFTQIGLLTVGSGPSPLLNISSFSASLPPAIPLVTSISQSDPCFYPSWPPQYQVCASTYTFCLPSPSHPLRNFQVNFQLVGFAVGKFRLQYLYFNYNDVDCRNPIFSSIIEGGFVVNGLSNCSGQCQDVIALRPTGVTATISPATQADVDLLNSVCPCAGVWVIGMPRVIRNCPRGSCSLGDSEFTNGLHIGSPEMMESQEALISSYFDYQYQLSRFEARPASFSFLDPTLTGSGCKADETTPFACGQYDSQCIATTQGDGYFSALDTFSGTTAFGSFTRVSRLYPSSQSQCLGQPDMQFEFTGEYATTDAVNCTICNIIIGGVYTGLGVTFSRVTVVANTASSLAFLQKNCPCGSGNWRLGMPRVLTVCPESDCKILINSVEQFSLGYIVAPALGIAAKVKDDLYLTTLSPGQPAPSSFSSFSIPLAQSNQSSSVCATGEITTKYCGTATSTCQGSTLPQFPALNQRRSLTLHGDTFGDFTYELSLYNPTDAVCSDESLEASLLFAGTYSVLGPALSGGLLMQFTLLSTNVSAFTEQIIDMLQTECPCGNEWVLGQERVIVSCPASSCSISLAGLQIGNSALLNATLFRPENWVKVSMFSNANAPPAFTLESTTLYLAINETQCQAPSTEKALCGVYDSACGAVLVDGSPEYQGSSSVTIVGTTFQQQTKLFSVTASPACSGVAQQSWKLTGTISFRSPSTCSGTCRGNATIITIKSATITVASVSDVQMLNTYCPCGGTWAVGVSRTITFCDFCNLSSLPAAHGLSIGTGASSYGTLVSDTDRLSFTRFSDSKAGFDNLFNTQTDRVFVRDGAASASLPCSGRPCGVSRTSDSWASARGGSAGLAQGQGAVMLSPPPQLIARLYADAAEGTLLIDENNFVYSANQHGVLVSQNMQPVKMLRLNGTLVSSLALVNSGVAVVLSTPTSTTLQLYDPTQSLQAVVPLTGSSSRVGVVLDMSNSQQQLSVIVSAGATVTGLEGTEVLWSTPLDSDVTCLVTADTQSSTVYAVSTTAIYAINVLNGLVNWVNPVANLTTCPLVFNGTVVYTSAGLTTAIDTVLGITTWQLKTSCSGPVALSAACHLVCASNVNNKSAVSAFSISKQQAVWTSPVSGSVDDLIVDAADNVLVLSLFNARATINVLQADTGTLMWQNDAQPGQGGTLAVDLNGNIFNLLYDTSTSYLCAYG